MKFTKTTILIFFNLILLCTVAFAGNIINEGLFLSVGDTLYYSEQNDGGKLYAETDGCKVKISDLNARYINYYDGAIYFCSTDDTGEYAAISKYDIETAKVYTLYAVEMVKGIKNLYVENGVAHFQSDGVIYTFSLSERKVTTARKDGEIVDFIPFNGGYVYTKLSGSDTPLYYFDGADTLRIVENVSAFDAADGVLYYTDEGDATLSTYTLSTKRSKVLCDVQLSNLIVDGGTVYGKGSNEYTVYAYNTATQELTEHNQGIYSYFNIVDGKIMSVYYSGALLTQTIFEDFSPIALTSFLPDTGSYKSWKQYDARWANVQFPNGETVRQVGCLVTSISILIVGSGVRDEANFNPGTFVEALKNNNGFSGASLYWSAVERVVPEFKVYSSWTSLTGSKSDKVAAIAAHLEAGRKVVIRAVSSQHWVAADRVENGKVYICDPGRDVTDLFDYYDAEDVTRIAVFHPVSSEATKYESGLYSITSDDGLRLRSGPGLTYDRLSLIPFETVIEVKDVGDEWGYTSYNGVNGWVFMQYAKYIGPLTYTIEYNANGGVNAPTTQKKEHSQALTLTLEQPWRDGYVFLGWSTNPAAVTPSYTSGALYTADENAVLYAVWLKSAAAPIYGDVDQNGVFNIKDILLVSAHLKSPSDYPFTRTMSNAADINSDGQIDYKDVELMRLKLSLK